MSGCCCSQTLRSASAWQHSDGACLIIERKQHVQTQNLVTTHNAWQVCWPCVPPWHSHASDQCQAASASGHGATEPLDSWTSGLPWPIPGSGVQSSSKSASCVTDCNCCVLPLISGELRDGPALRSCQPFSGSEPLNVPQLPAKSGSLLSFFSTKQCKAAQLLRL